MSAISEEASRPRAEDPRVIRSRAAVFEAARTLFLRRGYTGTTMEDIAEEAGVTRRTVYNNWPDKETLFREIAGEMIGVAGDFASGLREEFGADLGRDDPEAWLTDVAVRLGQRILRPEVIGLRRLLVGEARTFPGLAEKYFDAAPGRVIGALAECFEELTERGFLAIGDPGRAAAQFAYLVVGEPLDHAMLVGRTPAAAEVERCAGDGVRTFLARYAVSRPGAGRQD